jgi:putative nucleotidyltransferase with HDIG domain
MRRILFVDDELQLLDGLRRSIYPLRAEWQTEFACGASEALKLLALQPFDVIVSGVVMPGIDGPTLLETVTKHYPELLRIVLSAQSDFATQIRSAGVAHQYLSKPCSIEELKSAVNRTVSLRRVLQDPNLRAILSQIDALPSLPPLYLKMVKLLDSPNSSLDQIGAVIAKDMAMCAKVLQLANSAFFGRRQKISSPAAAAGLLGFDMVRSLSLAVHIFQADASTGAPGFRLEALWQHSLKVSLFAERIAQAIAPANNEFREQAQTAGLLHDVGRLVIARKLPKGYQAVRGLCASKGIEAIEAEREVFGATHAELGAYILALWGLPEAVVDAVAFHHSPERCQTGGAKRPAAVVYAANVLTHANSDAEVEQAASALAGLLPRLSPAALVALTHSLKEEPAHVA